MAMDVSLRGLRIGALALCTATLIACGGGDNDGDAPTPQNSIPVASAGQLQNVLVSTTVTLDGSASTDADGDALTYAWVLSSKPAGSAATLTSSASPRPSFSADVAGAYVATLIVNDGKADSAAASVTVTAAEANAAPVANAGADQNVTTNSTVALDGRASTDANGNTLTYRWTLTKPSGSSASLSSETSAQPTFVPDVVGVYAATLVVNDGIDDSTPASVTVNVTLANAAPVANAGTDQNVRTKTNVTLDGGGSSDANGDALTYRWTLTSKPDGSAVTLSAGDTAQPTFTPDLVGIYVATLVVNDGAQDSTASTVTVTAVEVKVKGAPYVATNGMTVTLLDFTSLDLGNGYTRHTAT